jgi:hypothetical protein
MEAQQETTLGKRRGQSSNKLLEEWVEPVQSSYLRPHTLVV